MRGEGDRTRFIDSTLLRSEDHKVATPGGGGRGGGEGVGDKYTIRARAELSQKAADAHGGAGTGQAGGSPRLDGREPVSRDRSIVREAERGRCELKTRVVFGNSSGQDFRIETDSRDARPAL
jgi:hypothetical protein